MKLKLDENLPVSLSDALAGLGHDVHTVRDERMEGRSDREVWEFAQREARFFITQDMDFSDVRGFVPGTHAGIMLVRLHAPSWRRLMRRVIEIFGAEDVAGWRCCFVVVTESKVRVVRPEASIPPR